MLVLALCLSAIALVVAIVGLAEARRSRGRIGTLAQALADLQPRPVSQPLDPYRTLGD